MFFKRLFQISAPHIRGIAQKSLTGARGFASGNPAASLAIQQQQHAQNTIVHVCGLLESAAVKQCGACCVHDTPTRCTFPLDICGKTNPCKEDPCKKKKEHPCKKKPKKKEHPCKPDPCKKKKKKNPCPPDPCKKKHKKKKCPSDPCKKKKKKEKKPKKEC